MSTLADLITIVKSDYLDDSSTLWDDAAMLRYFAEAENQACNRSNLIFDDSTTAYTSINLLDGVSSYALSQKINVLKFASINGVQCTQYAQHEIDRSRPAWRTETGIKGKAVAFVIRGRKIRIIPTPTASLDATFIQESAPASGMVSGDTWYSTASSALYSYSGSVWVLSPTAPLATLKLEIYRNPAAAPTATTYTPEIPDEMHRDLIYWVLHEAYKKQDADTFNQERSDYFLNRFTQAFGEYVPARVRANQLENPSSITLRPVRYESPERQEITDDDW